jgi:archaellum component FlaC
MIRGFVLTMVCALLLIGVPPLQAQQGTATAPPPPTASSAEIRLLGEIALQLQSMSENNSQTINGAVLLLGIGFILLIACVLVTIVWLARGGLDGVLKGLWETINAERRRANAAEESETHLRVLKDDSERRADEYRAKTAEALERTAKILAGLETSQDAQTRSDAAVNKIVTDINAHTDAVVAGAKEQLEQAAEHVEKAAETISDVVTKQHLSNELNPIRTVLDNIAVQLRKKGDTGPLPLLPEDFADPALNAAPPTEPSAEPKKED